VEISFKKLYGEEKMTHRNWLKSLRIKRTPKGARMDLRIYIYVDGHGHIQHIRPNRTVDEANCPVNNVEGAAVVLKELWKRAEKFRNRKSNRGS